MQPVPTFATAAQRAAIRFDLHAFHADAITTRLGEMAARALQRDDPLPGRYHLAGCTDQLGLQIRLFCLAESLTTAEINRALPELTSQGAAACQLITPAGNATWRATAMITAFRGLHIASDWLPTFVDPQGELAGEHVLGIGGASRTLLDLLPPMDEATVLDLGTGSGIQALACAAQARTVIATDISERALGFAELNIALNEPAAPIELRRGSLFAPLGSTRVDVVVSNPPFVITPPGAYAAGLPHYEYRDAGAMQPGDSVIRHLLGSLAQVLNVGGIAVLLANWECGEQIAEVSAELHYDLDVWVIERERRDIAAYSDMWLRDGGLTPQSALWEPAYGAYLEDFATRGVSEVAFGFILVANRGSAPGPPMRETTIAHGPPLRGDELWPLFRTRQWLTRASDDDIARARLVAGADVTMEHHFRIGESDPAAITITIGGGLHQQRQVATEVAGLLSACDGLLRVDQIAAALADLLEVDATAMLDACIAHARMLLANGYVHRDEQHSGAKSPS
ncbi:MAG: class I SAM-dependent methyltransferase [Bowdeniella nasicola]|nr:class I SAM-dependent methyltransferase [Bowdeniella nasicola]